MTLTDARDMPTQRISRGLASNPSDVLQLILLVEVNGLANAGDLTALMRNTVNAFQIFGFGSEFRKR